MIFVETWHAALLLAHFQSFFSTLVMLALNKKEKQRALKLLNVVDFKTFALKSGEAKRKEQGFSVTEKENVLKSASVAFKCSAVADIKPFAMDSITGRLKVFRAR